MKENPYDKEEFFEKYSNFPRSVGGLSAAGEWHELKKMLPDFEGKRVLDLGCGFGWHCIYAAENGAKSVVGVDISEKMLSAAKDKTKYTNVKYICAPIEDYEYEKDAFDIVISSLAFHYVSSFGDICSKVNNCLVSGGDFVFSAEHPIFTAQGKQDWIYDNAGSALYWPVDNYFFEGERNAVFLGESMIKYHRTMTAYIKELLNHGFVITDFSEPMPSEELLKNVTDMNDEMRRSMRRPMMLIISARKV